MTFPLSSIQKDFESLTEAMKVVGEQKAIEDSKGQKIYNNEEKVYIKLGENNRYVTEIGVKAKKSKGLEIEKLTEVIEKVISAANNSQVFESLNLEDLNFLTKGLEVLRERLEIRQKSISPLKVFILRAFGFKNKYDIGIEKVNSALKKVNVYLLPREIKNLKGEIDLVRASVENSKGKIKEIEEKEKQLNKNETDLNRKLASHQEDLKEVEENIKKLEENQTPLKQKIESLEKEQATGKAKKTFTFFKPQPKELKELRKQLKGIDEELGIETQKKSQLITRIQSEKSRLTEVESKFKEIENDKKIFNEKKLNLQLKEGTLRQKEAKLAALTFTGVKIELKKVDPFKVGATSEKSSLFDLLPNTTRIEQEIISDLKSRLKPISGQVDNYLSYQRRLIFGFSMGQKHAIDELNREIDFEVRDLKDILEGSHSFDTMFYIADYLENLIPQAKANKKDFTYIQSLEHLQADLKRSLPFAFKIKVVSSTPMNVRDPARTNQELEKSASEIREVLKQMKTGEKFLLPTGTPEHATLLCLQKNEDGTILPIFYNTGDGVEQHITEGVSVKALTDLLSTVRDQFPITKIYPSFDLIDPSLKFDEMIRDLSKLMFTRDSTVKEINDCLRKNLGEGRSGKPKPVQINGVCVFQVLSEVFKDILGSKLDYNTYKHDFLTHIQKEFQEITDTMKPTDENGKKLLKLHQKMLQDNQEQIDRTAKIIQSKK